ncbi:hypothetical protein [Desulfosarcina sp.]|uniref:hypothetical protein n=1 Tax=Desulfosarcina sp. TaxID=2027861 RepID=UPI003568C5F4
MMATIIAVEAQGGLDNVFSLNASRVGAFEYAGFHLMGGVGPNMFRGRIDDED